MAAVDGPCPGLEDIERMASGDGVAPWVEQHVESCDHCAQRLCEAQEEGEFLERVRKLAAPGLGPEGAPRIPGYRPLGIVSSGSQGIVYRAVQESTSRIVAIKALVAGEAASTRQRVRAEREAEIAARLRHPNIVTVYESRTLTDGRIVVVMEFIDGVPLDVWKPGGVSPADRRRELLQVFADVCGAIHHAHLNGVIHRDLKPDNILVTAQARPVVLDFGIAKAGGVRTTITGEFAGTPAYASPEQVSGKPDDVDALTDVYSLGVLLYRMLCGRPPYEVNGTIFDVARTIGETDPIPMREIDPTISPDLEAIVQRAMKKNKEQRYQSAAALGRDLQRFLAGDPVDARTGSGWYMLRKAVSLNRARLAWAGVGVVLVIAATVSVVLSLQRAAASSGLAKQRDEQARAESVRARAVSELFREALPSAELSEVFTSGLGRLYFRLETGAFKDDPAVDQSIRRMWGEAYNGFGRGNWGLIAYAEVSLRNGLVRLRLEHGNENPEIAATLHRLANVLLVRQRAPEAEPVCREALAMREHLDGPRSVTSAESRALLARIALALKRTAEAEREADAALSILRSLEGKEADFLIAAMCSLKARMRLEAGTLAGCEELIVEALTRRFRALPPEDPELLSSLEDAAALVQQAPGSKLAGIMSVAWGADPEKLPGSIRRDLPILGARSRGADSVRAGRTEALGRLLKFEERMLGPSDPALVGVLIAQIRVATAEDMPAERAAAALRAADILAQRYGPNDLSVLACYDEAALIFVYSGQPARAAEFAERACNIWDAIPSGARDPLLAANCRRYFAWCLAMAGRTADAIPVYRQSLDGLLNAVGPEHHVTALAEAGLAFCLAEQGEIQRADELSSHAVDIAGLRLATIPPDQLSHIRFIRGHVLKKLARHEEARTLFERAWEPEYRKSGFDFPWRHVIIEDLAEVSVALGDAAAADRWREWATRRIEGAMAP